MSMLLAETTGGNQVWNWVLIGVVALLLIAMPIMMNARNKRETQKAQEQTNSLKVGDKVLTTSGVYGTIVELKFDDTQKVVVIETGSKDHKSYMSVDAYAIYTVLKSDAELKKEAEEKAEAEKRALEAQELAKQEAEKAKAEKKASKKKKKEEKTEDNVDAVEVKTETKEENK